MILYNIIYIYVYYIIYIYTLVCLRSCRKAPQVQVGLINPPNCRDIHFFSTQDHWMMEPLDPRAEQCRAMQSTAPCFAPTETMWVDAHLPAIRGQ